ncbi:thiamine pyrophosphate-dependent enzyme [Herbaspirillum seropedicae]|uniref:thiamine pyrophosphate-dependent enzyme n=1 Tax=Herbaspirillum seropedicae TaxID=964 RepID=UPI002863214D|nr:thiamine pyrophosphate-dependent enzyme [Herbaspirillum seropedicae]MDR6397498.1 acetolactate synthase-1/2/3 large subunit [Herbaspirillum seropedicae]
MQTEMTGGEVLVDSLIRNDVKDLFFIPGIQLDWAVEALRKRSDELNLFVPRHEQTTTYMADGYYRASGKIGTAMVVPGPGALNAGAGLATAYASNSKIVFLTAQIHSTGVGKGYGLLHEIKDQTGFVKGLTKWNTFVNSAEGIAPALDAAYQEVETGRPRPVGIEIPHNYLETKTRLDKAEAWPATSPVIAAPEAAALEKAAKLINDARLPVLYVGGGIFPTNACSALQEVAERIGAPVVMSDNGRGALSDRHPLAMNSLAGRAVFQHADIIVVIGSRFADVLTPTASWPAGKARFVYINIDDADVTAPRVPDVAIIADAGVALEQLKEYLIKRVVLSNEQAQGVKNWAQEQITAIQPQTAYIDAMRQALPEDGVFVNELTQVGYLSRIAFPVYAPRTYIGPGYQGTLGYGFPVALGAAVGAGGRRVLSITGDGGFGWNLQELATAKRYNLPITLVVFNDGHFGNVRAIQKRVFGAEVAVELCNPDFQILAKAFGIPSVQVDSPEALGAAVRESVRAGGPAFIEVKVGVMPSPWHLLRLQAMAGMAGQAAPANPLDGVFS